MTRTTGTPITGTALRNVALAALAALLLAVFALNGLQTSSAAFMSQSANATSTASAAVDWTPPTVGIVAPDAPLRGSATIAADAADAETGIASVVVQWQSVGAASWTTLCSAASAPYRCSWDTLSAADGAYDVRAIATDKAAYATTSAPVRVTVANAFTVVLADLGDAVRGTTPLTATLTDADPRATYGVRFEYSVADANSWKSVAGCASIAGSASCTVNWATTSLASGDYDARVVAWPTARPAVVMVSETAAVTVDSIAPTVGMIDPGSVLTGTVTLAASPADAHSGVASVVIQFQPSAGGAWTTACTTTDEPWSCRFNTVPLPYGRYSFRAIATDLAGNSTTSAAVAGRLVDNTVSSISLDDPGAYLTGAVQLTATANSSAGVSSVAIQYSPAGSGKWSPVCTLAAAPYVCAWDTKTVADGSYDLRAVLTDSHGKQTTSTVLAARRVDNAPLRGADVQAVNGGKAGVIDAGDVLVLTYSGRVSPASIASGWDGSARAVTARVRDGGITSGSNDLLDVPNTNLGSVNLRGNHVGLWSTAQFSATMTATTETINGVPATVVRVTIGALTSGSVRTVTTAAAMTWTPSANATDLVGLRCSTTPVTESGALDKDF